MKLVLLCILIFCSYYGQTQRQLKLIIDTIDFIDDFDQYNNFKVNLIHNGQETTSHINTFETDTNAIISTKKSPNFQSTLNIKSDSTYLRIPIDMQKGYLELRNIYSFDTIRINYLKIYSNCNKDSSFTRFYYFRVVNNKTSEEPYDTKFKKQTIKPKCKCKPPLDLSITINNKNYIVILQKSEWTQHTRGHGRIKPRMNEKNHDNYTGTYFHFIKRTIKYKNYFILNF